MKYLHLFLLLQFTPSCEVHLKRWLLLPPHKQTQTCQTTLTSPSQSTSQPHSLNYVWACTCVHIYVHRCVCVCVHVYLYVDLTRDCCACVCICVLTLQRACLLRPVECLRGQGSPWRLLVEGQPWQLEVVVYDSPATITARAAE